MTVRRSRNKNEGGFNIPKYFTVKNSLYITLLKNLHNMSLCMYADFINILTRKRLKTFVNVNILANFY